MTTATSSLATQIAAFNAALPSLLPAHAVEAFRNEQARFEALGVPAGLARPGSVFPDGNLLDAHGNATTLAQARGGKPAVVVFYRGEWCPYCNLTLRAYQEQLLPGLTAQGVVLIAVSPQKADGALTAQEKNALTFTVLSDPGNQLGTGLGIVTTHSDEVNAVVASLGANHAATNADGTGNIPMATVALVDAGGTLRWIDVHPNYASRSEPAEILEAVQALLK